MIHFSLLINHTEMFDEAFWLLKHEHHRLESVLSADLAGFEGLNFLHQFCSKCLL